MKASVLLVVAGLALAAEASVTAAAASVTAAAGGLRSLAKMETNHFYLQGARITSCTQLSYSITSGQPYGGLSCSGDTITIMAGRDNSKGVATSFKSGLTGGNGLRKEDTCTHPHSHCRQSSTCHACLLQLDSDASSGSD